MGKFLDSVKNKKVDNNKNTSTSTKKVGKFGKSVMESKIGLDTLESDLKALGTTVENIYNGWQPQDTMNNTKASILTMQERLNAYQEYVKLFGGQDAGELVNGYQAILDDWDNRTTTYGKFKTAEDYTKAAEREKSLPTADLNAVSTEIDDLDKQLAEIKAQKEKLDSEYAKNGGWAPSASNYNRPSQGQIAPYQEWQAKSSEYEKQIKDLENKKADRQAFYEDAKTTQENLALIKKETEMASDPQNMDGYNQYIANYDAARAKEQEAKGNTPLWVTAMADAAMSSDVPFNYAFNTIVKNKSEDKSWQLPQGDWSDDEKRVLGGYFREDPKKALDYVVRLNNEKAKDEQSKTEQGIQDSATSNFFAGAGHTVGALVSSTFGLADYMDDLTDVVAGRPIIEESFVTPFEYSQAVTGGITTHLNELSGTLNEDIPVLGGKGLGDVYGLGYSVAQSAASAYALGPVGTLVSYFGQGAAAGVDDALARGATDEQALLYGLALGAAEGVSEYIGADKLLKLGSANEIRKVLLNGFKKGGGKEFWSLVNKQGVAEGLEESFSSFAGQVADNYILKGKSKFETLAREYRALGMSAEEATKKAWEKSIGDVAFDTLSGYLSGAIHAGPQVAVSAGKQNAENKTIGKEIRGNERIGDVLDIASLSPQEMDAYKAYTKYVEQGINADNITDAQLGNIYGMLDADARTVISSKKSTKENVENAETTLNRLATVNTKNRATKVASELAQTDEEGVVTPTTREMVINEQAKGMSEAEAELFRTVDDGHSNAVDYADSFNLVVALAQHEIPKDYILEHRGVLSTAQVKKIYQEVVTNPKMAQQKGLDALVKEQGDNLEIKGTIDDSAIDYDNTGAEGKVNWNDLDPNVKATVAYISGFATKVAGMDVVLVTNGREHGFRGMYDRQGNVMYIDITANAETAFGTDTKGRKKGDVKFIMSAVAHEVTHWMEEKAPELYEQYSKMVMDALTSGGLTAEEVLGRRRALLEKAEARRAEKENRKPRKITDKEVMREVIARASEDMLALSEEGKKFFESLSESEQKNFVAKIQEVIQNIKDWIKSVLSKLKSDAPEAKELRALAKDLDAISQKWDEMLRQAATVNAAMKSAGITMDELVNGISEDGTTIVGKNNIQMSELTYAEGGRDFLSDWLDGQEGLTKEDKQDILNQTDRIAQLMKDIRENNELPDYAKWAAMDVVKDENGEKVLSVIVKNGDYAMNIDFSQVCKKRVALNAVLNAMVKSGDLNAYTLTETDVAELNAIIKEHEFEIACALCFVDSKRYRVGSWAESFCEGSDKKKNGKTVHQYGFNEMVRSLIPKGSNIRVDEFNFTNRNIVGQPTNNLLSEMDDSELDFTLIDEILESEYKPNGKNTDLYTYAKAIKDNKELRKILNPAEIISSIGLDAIRLQNQDLYKLINRHQGTAKPKFSHDVVAYGNDILKASNFTKEKAKMVGGVRCQSFSDFMANMVFDYVQFISELSAKELTAHSYTKEPLFVKLFGLTGMKINMSLVPKAVQMTPKQQQYFAILNDENANRRSPEYQKAKRDYKKLTENAGLDANGNYIWEDETFPYDVAMDIVADPRYSANCGTIAVGISDNHILKLLNDNNISMVIPYHKSGLNHIVAMMRNIDLYVDYTKTQNTRFANGKKLEKVPDFDFYGDLYGVDGKEGTNDPKKTAENYLKWCDEHNYIPKFEKSLIGRKFRDNPNYYKLLIDFRVYDTDGTYREQQAVKPIYPPNEEFKDLILNGVVGKDGTVYGGLKQQQGTSDKLNAEAQQIIDEYRERLKTKYGKDVLAMQYSDIDAEYMDAAENGNMELAQAMVNQAADSSQGKPARKITADMSDAERYEILKNRKMRVAVFNKAEYERVVLENPELLDSEIRKSEVEKLLRRIGEEFGVFTRYSNTDFEIEFEFSRKNLGESVSKQKGNYNVFAQMLSCFPDVITNAVGIETHNRNSAGYKKDRTLKNFYVLCSAFENETSVIPVKLEIKEFTDKPNHLYVAVALEGTKKDRVVSMGVPNTRSHVHTSPVAISIHELFSKINPLAVDFLKYIPKGFLNAEQKEKVAAKLDADYVKAVESKDMDAVLWMVREAAKRAGYTIEAYHGSRNEFTVFSSAKRGSSTNTETSKRWFFAADKTTANSYYPYGVIETLQGKDAADKIKNKGKLYHLFLRMTNPLEADVKDYDYSAHRENRDAMMEYSEQADRNGNDGIILYHALDNQLNTSARESTVYMFRDSAQAKSADPITYDDNGNIIPLSKRFDSTNEDIRYSDIDAEVDIYEVLGENKRLHNENAKLREDFGRLMERLALERQLTHGNHFNENQLNAVAGHIRNIANSKYSKTELVAKLKEVYTYLATSKEVTWDDLFARLYGIAEDVLRESKTTVVNDYFANIYKDIRSTEISLNDEQKQYIQSMLGVNWHKAFFGKIKVSDNGIPLNSVWQEWAEKYPNEFTETNDKNQVLELLDIYETAKELKEVVEEYNDVEQARWLANELYNQYWNVSTITTTADRYDKKIKFLNFAHRKAMQELRDSYNERLENQKKADKQKRSEIFKRLREKHQEDLREVRQRGKERLDKYKEEAARKTRIHSITSQALTLNEWLVKNSKDKHIHESMKGPVVALLQAIDFSSKRALGMWGGDLSGMPTQKDISLQKALSQVQRMMADASVGKEELVMLYGHELDGDIASMIESVDNIMRTVGDNEFILNKMALDDLITLDNVVRTIKHAVTQMNKFHIVHHAKGIANLAQEEIGYAESLGKEKVYNGKSFKASVKKLLAWKNINPYYAFKRFGAAGRKIFEAFQDGYDKFAFNIKEIIDFTNSTYKAKEVQDWEKEIKSFKVRMPATENELSNPDYEPQYQQVQMTVAQIMDLYLLNKREAARVHLLGGGIRVADIDAKGGKVITQAEGVVLEEREIDEIIKTLTPRQIEVADALSRFMNTTTTDWGNEVSMARFGYKAFGEKNYVPMQVDKNNLAVDDETEKNNILFRLLNMSFTKGLTEGANNRLVVSSIFDVFAQHTSDMAKYNALALPVLDAFRWYNYKEKGFKGETAFVTKSVKQAIENAFGKDGQSYITTFLKDLNGQENTSRDTIGRGFFTKAKIAAVGANIRVALLQPTAYLKASANIDNKYLIRALFHKPKIGRAEKYCGMALWKSLGYFDTNVQRGVAEQIKHAETKYDKAVELSMKGAEWGDKVTFGYLWNAAELEIRDKRKDLKVGSDEFYFEVGKRLRDIIYSTQVVDSVMTRSEMMRSPDWGDKLLTTFASEPTLAYNMLADAYWQTLLDARELGDKKAAFKKNAKHMARVFTAYTVTNLVAALIESGFDVLRDDDEEEMDMAEFMKLYFENFATNQSITAKIPWLKEAVSILQGFTSTRMDTQWIQTFSNTLKQVAKLMQGEGNPSKLIKNGLQTISYAFGLPFYNTYRDLLAVLNKLDILTNDELEEILSDFY